MDESDELNVDDLGWEKLLQASTLALDVTGATDSRSPALGTGFFVAPGIVATCAHVVGPDARELPTEIGAYAASHDRRLRLRVDPELYFRDETGLDLALLEVAGETDISEIPYVLASSVVDVGDQLWTYGYPEGMFRAGQPALFRYVGESRRSSTGRLSLARATGTPVRGGTSGSPVANRRTGAVCGMLCTSDLHGSAHLLPVAEIAGRCEAMQQQLDWPAAAYARWLTVLTDRQLRAGNWPYPSKRLREYLRAVADASQRHPYPNVVAGPVPSLSTVFVEQQAQVGGSVLQAAEIFDRSRDSLLIGAAGAGKSSLLLSEMNALAAKCLEGVSTAAPVLLLAADFVPARPLAELISTSVAADTSLTGLSRRWPAEFFEEPPIPGGTWIVLVDGFDELMNAEHRRAVVRMLARVRDSEQGSLYQFVVAMRPLPEDEATLEASWSPARYELLPFDDDQLDELTTRWYVQLGVSDLTKAKERFLGHVKGGALGELVRVPLMASMLCQLSVANFSGALTRGRTGLYEAFVELLNRRQYADATSGLSQQLRIASAAYGQRAERAAEQLMEQAETLISRLAWSRQTGVVAPAVQLLSDWTATSRPPHVPSQMWASLIRELLRRSGVLVERGGEFAFLHQTIAEYLAAQYVLANPVRSDEEFRALLRSESGEGPPPALRSQSYARFCMWGWRDRKDLASTLSGLAETGLEGARFVAALVTDGMDLGAAVVQRLLAGLARLASASGAGREQVRTARGLLVELLEDPHLDDMHRKRAARILASANQRSHRPRHRVPEGTARASGSPPADPALEPLLRIVRATHPKADLSLVEEGYRTAERLHRGQTRRTGEAYVRHPLAVAMILAELGMGPPTLCAALLHDTVDVTPYTIDELRAGFGDEVAYLVDGVRQLDNVKYSQHMRADTTRRMVIAMAKDIRVLLIKIADRLHNLRTLRYFRQTAQERLAQETLDVYAPLAGWLGLNKLKWETEDVAFATLRPKLYDEIVRLVAERIPSRDEFLRGMLDQVTSGLARSQIQATVTGRPKPYYSIYQKMTARGYDFDRIYDLVGIRVLTDSVGDCYAALGVLHGIWNPVPGRFKDYIATPKSNLYQSLHTTVIGPEDKPVEIQIRTKQMDRRAEYGSASHRDNDDDAGAESPHPRIQASQIYVYTPKSDVIELPVGSTPIDLAYAIHTSIGHRCIGARVNGRLVPPESLLENGDTVDVLTSVAENAGPSRDWLDLVRSPKARRHIRQWFTKEDREDAIEHGKDLLTRMVREKGVPVRRALSDEAVAAVAADLNFADADSLYAGLSEGSTAVPSVLRRLMDVSDTEGDESAGGAEGVAGVDVPGERDAWVRLARCCQPAPGDPIVGFAARNGRVSVHRRSCHNLGRLAEQPDRIVEVQWSPMALKRLFLVQIQVEALDREGLLSDITRVLSGQHINIQSTSVVGTKDCEVTRQFTFEMGDPRQLDHVLRAVSGVDGVFDAYRVTS